MLTLGTGVGGGLILDGKPYRGATGSGAELGHIVLEPGGPPCGCGGRGHLESFAERPGGGPLAQLALRRRLGRAQARHTRAEGRPVAVEALAGVGRYLGAGIASFVNVFEPEVVVVGGGFGSAGELLLGACT